jgi:hypothetical protein
VLRCEWVGAGNVHRCGMPLVSVHIQTGRYEPHLRRHVVAFFAVGLAVHRVV